MMVLFRLDLKLVVRYHGLSLVILGLVAGFLMVMLRETPSLIPIPPLMFMLTGLSPLASDPRREPNEFRHYVVTGVDFRDLIFAKNVSVMILFGISAGTASLIMLFLTNFEWELARKIGAFYLMTGFPLLIIGNYFFALRGVRRGNGKTGLSYLFRHSALLGLGSVPFVLVCGFLQFYLLIVPVVLLQGFVWYLSLPHVKRLVEFRISCLNF